MQLQIEQYGLTWTVKPKDLDGTVYLKQGSGLVFCGLLRINPFFGPYIDVNGLYCKNKILTLREHQHFFAQELDVMFDYNTTARRQIEWYKILQRGYIFPKSMFKFDYGDWRMPLSTVLKHESDGTTPTPGEVVYYILGNVAHGSYIHVGLYRNRPNLYVTDKYYQQLPENWTIHDLYKLDKEYQDSAKQIMEVLWHEIAEARTNNKPIRLVTEYEVTPVLYLETNNKYNIALPTILEKKRTYLTQDYVR